MTYGGYIVSQAPRLRSLHPTQWFTSGAVEAGCRNVTGDYDRRWRSLVELPALAIDDLEQFAPTEWANERLAALIDQRWRTLDRRLTAVAVTTLPGQLLTQAALPERILRRLTDARSIVVTVCEAHD